MAAILPRHKLAYFPVPKVACTSLKKMFFRIENGHDFNTYYANGVLRHIHNAGYPARKFEKEPHAQVADYIKLAVVRDPVERLISCYSNRAVYHKALAPYKISPEFQEKGATPNPSLEYFVRNLRIYRKASQEIAHHSNPLVFHLGTDPDYFDGIYSVKNLDGFKERVERIVGMELTLTREQTGGPKLSLDDLSAEARKMAQSHFAEDYEVFGRWFRASP